MEEKRLNLNRIKVVLAMKGKTNLHLKDHLAVTPNTVSTWTSNKHQPSIETLVAIARYLNVDPGELLTPLKDIAPIIKRNPETKKH